MFQCAVGMKTDKHRRRSRKKRIRLEAVRLSSARREFCQNVQALILKVTFNWIDIGPPLLSSKRCLRAQGIQIEGV